MSTPSDHDSDDPIDASLEDPIDAEFREADLTPAKGSRSGPGWTTSLLLTLLAAVGGGAIGYAASELAPGTISTPAAVNAVADPELRQMIEQATTQTDSLASRLDALETQLELQAEARTSVPTRVDLEAIRNRLSDLEDRAHSTSDTLPGDNTAAFAAIETLSQRLDALEVTPQTDTEGQTEALDALAADLLRLRNGLSALEGRLDTLASDVTDLADQQNNDQDLRADAALALASIDAAARRGDGFAPALAALKRVRPNDPRLADLEAIALDGAPTVAALQAGFIEAASAGRAALSPDIASSGALGWAGQIFGDALDVRDPDAEPAYAAIETAEALVARGDIDAALLELEQAGPTISPALAAMSDWIEGAKARQTLERQLDSLRLDLMAEDR